MNCICTLSFWNCRAAWGLMAHRVRNSRPSARVYLDSPNAILQESTDSCHITGYTKNIEYVFELFQKHLFEKWYKDPEIV